MDPDVQVILNNTVGAMLIGVMVSTLLFGCVTKQVFIYYQSYPRDKWHLKALVATLWLLEFSHTICIVYGVYWQTVTRHSQLDFWNISPGSIIGSYFTCFILAIVQAFYTRRVMKCFNNLYLVTICWILMAFDFVVFIAYITLAHQGEASLHWVLACTTAFFVTGCVDILNSIFLSFYLVKNRRHSAQTSTILVLNRLTKMTIITGLVMAVTSIAIAVLILTSTAYKAWYAPATYCQGNVYSNLMLIALNSRIMHRETLVSDVPMKRAKVPQSQRSSGHPTDIYTCKIEAQQILVEAEQTTPWAGGHDSSEVP